MTISKRMTIAIYDNILAMWAAACKPISLNTTKSRLLELVETSLSLFTEVVWDSAWFSAVVVMLVGTLYLVILLQSCCQVNCNHHDLDFGEGVEEDPEEERKISYAIIGTVGLVVLVILICVRIGCVNCGVCPNRRDTKRRQSSVGYVETQTSPVVGWGQLSSRLWTGHLKWPWYFTLKYIIPIFKQCNFYKIILKWSYFTKPIVQLG